MDDGTNQGMGAEQLRIELAAQARVHGHAVVAVTGDGEGPSFAYTVGLAAFEHPELLVAMENQEVAHALLNDLGFLVRDGRARFDTAAVFPADPEGRYDAVAAPVPPMVAAEHATMADAVARATGWPAPVAVAQVHVMDADRLWPWETSPRFGPPVPGTVLTAVPDVAALPRLTVGPERPELAPGVLYDTRAHVCVHVQRGDRPVLLVFRDAGGWSLVCGERDHDWETDVRPALLGRLVDLDPSLAALLDLPDAHEAERDEPGLPWARTAAAG
ncbi:MAG TPA: DUF4262 domain-containing protein [Nocardioides sp.]